MNKTNAEILRDARARARASGKCTQCRKRDAKLKPNGEPGATCQDCLDELHAQRDANVAAGLCMCGNEREVVRGADDADHKPKMCATCRSRRGARARKERKTRYERGLCGRGSCKRERGDQYYCTVHRGSRHNGGGGQPGTKATRYQPTGGESYGCWVVISASDQRSKHRAKQWLCKASCCGIERLITLSDLEHHSSKCFACANKERSR